MQVWIASNYGEFIRAFSTEQRARDFVASEPVEEREDWYVFEVPVDGG